MDVAEVFLMTGAFAGSLSVTATWYSRTLLMASHVTLAVLLPVDTRFTPVGGCNTSTEIAGIFLEFPRGNYTVMEQKSLSYVHLHVMIVLVLLLAPLPALLEE